MSADADTVDAMKVLSLLAEAQEVVVGTRLAFRPSWLASALRVSESDVHSALERLTAHGLVEREAQTYRLTDDGVLVGRTAVPVA